LTYTHTCKGCSIEFTTIWPRQIYHSRKCMLQAMRRRHTLNRDEWHQTHPLRTYTHRGHVTTDTGTLNELRIATELLAHGFIVYKNLSTRGADLVAQYKQHVWTIEVKTGARFKATGKLRILMGYQGDAQLLALSDNIGTRYIDTATRKTITLDELTAL
jgi:hypothetical protein